MRSLVLAAALALLALLAGGDTGHAAPSSTFNVNTTADLLDSNLGDSKCDVDPITPGDQCSLRAAITQSNARTGVQTINVPAGDYNLSRPDSLSISDEVTLHGAGSDVTIVAGAALAPRVFDTSAPGVEISGITTSGTSRASGPSRVAWS